MFSKHLRRQYDFHKSEKQSETETITYYKDKVHNHTQPGNIKHIQ